MTPWYVSAWPLTLVGLAIGYAAVAHAAIEPLDWYVALLMLGFAGLFYRIPPSRGTCLGERIALWAAVLFPFWVAYQLIPLPLYVLHVLSPTRGLVASAVQAVAPPATFAPLTIGATNTFFQLSRIAGCVIVFFVIAGALRQSRERIWIAAIPLFMIGGLEAVAGLAQYFASAPVVQGTYYSKDHFAGLLEMLLPFAIMYAVATLARGRFRGTVTTYAAGKASIFLALAAALLAAITASLSKMGFISMLGSLCVMFVLWVSRSIVGGRKRLGVLACLGAVALAVFVFLPSEALVNQLGGAASDPTGEGRLPIARDTLHLIAAYPLFGTGFGTYYPALLPYQTFAVGLAWTNAHNDYLQLLSELGIVGFLIPAALISAGVWRSVTTAASNAPLDVRYLGIACAGSLASLLIHSLADFNSYIPANALVLAWVLGIAVGLPAVTERPALRLTARTPPFLHGFVPALGCLACLYSGAWMLFHYRFDGDLRAERAFCRFGICDTVGALKRLQSRYGGDTASIPPGQLARFLKRDPAGTYRWCDMGESFQKAGRIKEARYCFSQALALGPRIPSTLFRAAQFHFNVGESGTATALVIRTLESDPSYGESSFDEFQGRGISVETALRSGLPSNPNVWRSYLSWQVEHGYVSNAITVWNQLVPRGYADDATANNFVNFLLGKKQPEAAVQAWTLYAGSRSKGYPDAERVFNGDFESDPRGSPFDWGMDKAPGAAIDFDTEVRHGGARSLRVRFDGTQNLNRTGLQQTVVLKPGRYRFSAWVRTKDLSTNEGVAFSVAGQDGPGPNFTTESLLGSTDWKLVEREFVAPPGTSLAMIRLTRKPSLKFDNLLKGTLWIDQVSIQPER